MPEWVLHEGDAGDAIKVTFKAPDDDGNLVAYAPTTAEYRIDCLSNGQAVKGWTSITPVASTVTVTLDADDTGIINDDNEAEQRRVTVVADRGLASQKSEQLTYWVRNLAVFE